MKMWTVKPFLLLSPFLLAAPAACSQAQLQNNSDAVIKTCTELVVVDAHVLKRTGEIVRGLNREDFTIFEDGVKQQIDAREGDLNTKLDQLVDLLRGRYSFG